VVLTTEVEGVDGKKCAGHNSQEHQVSDGQPKCDETDGNSVFSVVSIPFTAAMMVAEMTSDDQAILDRRGAGLAIEEGFSFASIIHQTSDLKELHAYLIFPPPHDAAAAAHYLLAVSPMRVWQSLDARVLLQPACGSAAVRGVA
jgi:hypothetical protein